MTPAQEIGTLPQLPMLNGDATDKIGFPSILASPIREYSMILLGKEMGIYTAIGGIKGH